MRAVLTMAASDLRQRARDRSVYLFALVVPLALIAVFNLVFGDAEGVRLEPVTVAVAAPADDELAAAVTGVLRDVRIGGEPVTVVEAAADQVRGEVVSGAADVGLVIPPGFGADVRAGEPVPVGVVEGTGNEVGAQVALTVVEATLDRLAAGSVTAVAGARAGVPADELAGLAEDAVAGAPAYRLVEGERADEQLDAAGALVAGQAGLFLLFTVGFGVLALVGERETGTLARLRSMPLRTGQIVAAKALVSFVLGVVATTVLLVAGGWLFGVGFGSPVGVAVLVLSVVTAATSVMFVIARLARTSEQAGIAQSITALVLGVAGGAFFPVDAPGAAAALLDLNPVAAFTRGLGITASGGSLLDVTGPVAVLLGFAVVMVLVSRLVPDRGAAA